MLSGVGLLAEPLPLGEPFEWDSLWEKDGGGCTVERQREALGRGRRSHLEEPAAGWEASWEELGVNWTRWTLVSRTGIRPALFGFGYAGQDQPCFSNS